MPQFALIYAHPFLQELPEGFYKLTPKQKHECCKGFHEAHGKTVYSEYIKLLKGCDLTKIREQISEK